jgi:hypothetical protein
MSNLKFKYTNEKGFVTRITITRITAKSVFFKYTNGVGNTEFRMSKKSFAVYRSDL